MAGRVLPLVSFFDVGGCGTESESRNMPIRGRTRFRRPNPSGGAGARAEQEIPGAQAAADRSRRWPRSGCEHNRCPREAATVRAHSARHP